MRRDVSFLNVSEVAQTRCLKIAGIYFLTALHVRSLKSKCEQNWFLLRAKRKNLVHASLLASCCDQPSLAFLSFCRSDLCSCVHVIFSLYLCLSSVQFSHSVVSNSAAPWTAARQASLSTTSSQSLLKLMSIESVMPSSHLILCRPLLLLPSVLPRVLCLL